MRNLLLMLLALVGVWRAEAQLDPRVAKLETDFFVAGDFRQVGSTAEELSGYMEVMSRPENRIVVHLYQSLAEAQLQVCDKQTLARLEEVGEMAAVMGEPMLRYLGLAQVGQTIYYTATDAAKAAALGAEAYRTLCQACGGESREASYGRMCYGHALTMKGDILKAIEAFTATIDTLKSADCYQSWLGVFAHLQRGTAYMVLRNEGMKELETAFECMDKITSEEMDERSIGLTIYPFGVGVYIYTACGLFDQAIELSKSLLGFMEYLQLTSSMDYGTALSNTANAYLGKQDYTTALEYYQRAKQQYETYGYTDTDVYRTLMNNINWAQQQ